MLKYGYEAQGLIETLHTVQESFGYLNEAALRYVSNSLNMRPSVVYGVATFYHFFSLVPPAAHTCVVCTGTACHIKGSQRILDDIDQSLSLQPGQTTPDGCASLQVARCVGFCSPAPVALFDQAAMGAVCSETVIEHIRSWSSHVNR
jgi:bidirectional [NiFe] hydrogenase diaphorase subunit